MARKKFEITPEQIQDFRNATLMDDVFMKAFFEDNIPATETILRIIMDKPDLVVISMSTQETLKGFDGSRGVVFDVYAVDSKDTQYDIEVQNKPDGATPFRADFNSAMMTVRTLKKREDFSTLSERERVVIFITATDVLKGGLPIYRIDRVIKETGQDFGDNNHIIYVNVSHEGLESELGKLIHDFRNGDEGSWYHSEWQAKAKEARKKFMKSWEVREEQVRTDEKAVTSENIALNFIKMGKLAFEEIARGCNLTLQQVKDLAATVKA